MIGQRLDALSRTVTFDDCPRGRSQTHISDLSALGTHFMGTFAPWAYKATTISISGRVFERPISHVSLDSYWMKLGNDPIL